jgi:hypothetical protein
VANLSPTTPSDGSSTTAQPLTLPPDTPSSPPPGQSPNIQAPSSTSQSTEVPTAAPPQAPADSPTITPDIGTASPPGDPRIEVIPKIGPIPTTYTLKIENFDQGEHVTIQIISKKTSGIVDSFVVIVDGKGALVNYWTSKADYDIGGYYVKAIGANYGKYALGELDIQ